MSAEGIIPTNWFIGGIPKTVLVDDSLPFVQLSNEQYVLPFASNGAGAELWIAYLEKAWAKITGNYKHTEYGSVGELWHNLLSIPVITSQVADSASWWEQLESYKQR